MPQQIRTLRVEVRIGQPGHEPETGILSLAPRAQFHSGPETILERLNAQDRMVPLERSRDGLTLLLNRQDIEWVEPASDVDRSLVGPRTYLVTREERVLLRLASGEEREGLIQMELPENRNRASDFLNAAEDFFALQIAGRTLLVNKHQVRNALLYETSPLPIEDTSRA